MVLVFVFIFKSLCDDVSLRKKTQDKQTSPASRESSLFPTHNERRNTNTRVCNHCVSKPPRPGALTSWAQGPLSSPLQQSRQGWFLLTALFPVIWSASGVHTENSPTSSLFSNSRSRCCYQGPSCCVHSIISCFIRIGVAGVCWRLSQLSRGERRGTR